MFHQYKDAEIKDVIIVPVFMTIKYQHHDKYEIKKMVDIVLNEDEYISTLILL
ncbi:hypothetical protein M3685_11240 [Heyndrickxia oleronia]|uniref:hypothetical protein n=1 Tax=Heyndrickxia oleronia TaxID=38875 RepID=UPI002041E369|nr:hypothetical protein [Heyndrickxia oleronia]MCM3454518.1 hypothetical protein [Heyndrickxia oleronia]